MPKFTAMRIFMILASIGALIVGLMIWAAEPPPQTKFVSANQKVYHDVTFGGGGGSYDYRPSIIPTHSQSPPREAPPAPTRPTNPPDYKETINFSRKTRQMKRPARSSGKPNDIMIMRGVDRSDKPVAPKIRPAPPLEPEALAAPARAKRPAGEVNPMVLVAE